MSELADRVARFWWADLPLAVCRRARTLASAMTDGVHLVRWPAVAALAPVSAVVLGWTCSARQQGHTFTTSVIVIAVLAAIASSSVLLALASWVGYVASDVVLNPHVLRPFSVSTGERWFGVPVGMAVEYLLLGILLVGIPMAVLAARMEIRNLGWARVIGSLGEHVIHLTVLGGLVYFWTRSLPVLIRPVFTLQDMRPPAEAVVPVQEDPWVYAVVAVVAAVARLVVERRAVSPIVVDWVRDVSTRFLGTGGSRRTPRAVRYAGAAGVMLLLLAGLISNWLQAALVVVALLGILTVRDLVAASPRLRWLARVPVVARFAVSAVLGWLVIEQALESVSRASRFGFGGWDSNSFAAALVGVMFSIAVTIIVCAPVGAQPEQHRP
jgi:hypothetical protein